MQVKLYWVVIIMDIFIIYAKYEESSTISSIYIVHNVFFLIVWKKDVSEHKCMFTCQRNGAIFILCTLFCCGANYAFCSIMENLKKNFY